MANQQKGEVSFEHEGKTYTLCFSVNAQCKLEGTTGEPSIRTFAAMSDPATAFMAKNVAIFWAGLSDHHPDLTLHEAGALMWAIGVKQANELWGKAISLAFPVPEGEQGPLAEQPASQQDGTGKSS